MRSELRSTIYATGLALGAIGLQVLPLIWGRSFAFDWTNHAWIIQYTADFLSAHGTFPSTYDARQAFGNPSPLFYGTLFYPLMSLLALLTGADLALRLSIVALIVAPLVSLALLFGKLTGSRSNAILLATICGSSVYQMTNLYSRSAMTEFFAVQFLLLGISLCLYGLMGKSRSAIAAIAFGSACVTIAAGTHPITLYTFVLFTIPVAIFGVLAIRKEIVASSALFLVACAVLSVIVMAPWLHVTLSDKAGLQLSTTDSLARSLHFFPSSIDSIFGRLGFVYFDPRVAAVGIGLTSTPFLDAPFSLPLAVMFAFVVYRLCRLRRLTAVLVAIPALASALALLYASHAPAGSAAGIFPGSVITTARDGLLHALLIPLQFAYRLAAAWQLVLVTALAIGMATISRHAELSGSRFRDVAMFATILTLLALAPKLYSTNLEYRQYPLYHSAFRKADLTGWSGDIPLLLDQAEYAAMVRDTTAYPRLFYGQVAYSTPGDLARTPASHGLPVQPLTLEAWGEQPPVTCATRCLLATNLLPSPGNRIIIDGTAPQETSLSDLTTLDIVLPAGTHRVVVDKIGRRFAAFQVAAWIAVGWFVASAILAAFCLAAAMRAKTLWRSNQPVAPGIL